MEEINLLYHSCPFDLSGYGTVARNHLLKLAKIKGLNIRLRTKKFWAGASPDLREDGDILHSLERNPIPENSFIFLHHLTPENFFIDPRARYHICYTPFETDGLPMPWLLPLKAMDEVWVPSEHNKAAYIRAGLRDKVITVIPHGINVDRYNPEIKPLDYNRGKFNFGSVFDWTERKNPVALIRAYYNSFFSGEDVTLTIRTFWRFPLEKTAEYVRSEIQQIKDGYSGRKDFPRILFWFDTMDEQTMPHFFKSFDCFVLPTRGEGFGLPFLEAMACGVPTIGPKWGGNREFMDETNSVLVDGKVVPIADPMFLRYQPQYAGQGWFDIDEVELSKQMRWVYDNKEKADVLARKAVADIGAKFTWDTTAGKIYKRLLEIDSELKAKGK
jgi:glycosyltransferase involved in cell wall biosynthesis